MAGHGAARRGFILSQRTFQGNRLARFAARARRIENAIIGKMSSSRRGKARARLGIARQGVAWQGAARQDEAFNIHTQEGSMRIATAHLESISPYSQSRHYNVPKLGRDTGASTESSKDYEERTWRERCHVDADGWIYVPPMAFKNCLSEIAKYLGMQIPGQGKKTYTKHFEAGVLVMDPLPLKVRKEDVPGEWLFVPPDGRRGGNTRVEKCFPMIAHWAGAVKFYILDDVITEAVFETHLREAGNFIGIGRFRPRKNGFYGRFRVNAIEWGSA
jgi:hypothetical protein